MSDISGISGYNSNRIRMTGLATGMDTEAMIKKMMAAENMKVDKMKQNRQYVQWQQEGYRDIMKDLSDLRQNYFLIESSADTNLMKSSTYSGSNISTSILSGSSTIDANDYVTATALPGAVNGTSSITVNKLAKSAAIQGNRLSANSVSIGDPSDWNGKQISFNVNGSAAFQTGAISGVTSVSDLAGKINDAINSNQNLKGKVKASIDGSNVKFDIITSDFIKISSETGTAKLTSITGKELNPNLMTKLSDLKPDFTQQSFYIKQNGKTSSKITITKDDRIEEVLAKINNAQSQDGNSKSGSLYTDLKIGYSELNKNLTIETRNTGSSQTLQILDGDKSTPLDLNILGLSNSGTAQTGQDAEVSITPPGASSPTTISKSSNNFTIDNVTYNLIKDPGTTPYNVTLTTKPDSQKSFEKIKAFVEKYNTIVKKISDKVQEKKEYSYKPLTDAQKKDMKEDEIKAWEERAKKGIFKNDGELQSILTNLRRAFSDEVKSSGITLKEIGIDTYAKFEAISKPGQLKIDEAKLKSALENRGDQVMKLFTSSPDYSIKDDKEKYSQMGIFRRMEDLINKSVVKSDASLVKKVGYVGSSKEVDNDLTKKIKSQDKSITEMQKKLAVKENSYYSMFARLEKAMNQLNSQQNWLMQQMGQ